MALRLFRKNFRYDGFVGHCITRFYPLIRIDRVSGTGDRYAPARSYCSASQAAYPSAVCTVK